MHILQPTIKVLYMHIIHTHVSNKTLIQLNQQAYNTLISNAELLALLENIELISNQTHHGFANYYNQFSAKN